MAAAHFGGRAVAPAAATSLTSLFSLGVGSPAKGRGFHYLSIQAAVANAAIVYIGKDNTVTAAGVNAVGALSIAATPINTFIVQLQNAYGNTDNVFIIGNAADFIYVSGWE